MRMFRTEDVTVAVAACLVGMLCSALLGSVTERELRSVDAPAVTILRQPTLGERLAQLATVTTDERTVFILDGKEMDRDAFLEVPNVTIIEVELRGKPHGNRPRVISRIVGTTKEIK